ncbi:TatD family hydrolase [Psychrosphaera sp. 1_MG-2023]|uniref:TatD family hydrolase n=1 Tax=Psychrosphaera sp. 1_MG-2023 TaxID=3062643 RepID=UPI0026E39A1A|nr:TatD family hydrolase [Psychrosphaera sp. 1_MG-2023]MDO6720605.1 TatD family hydrolase [Psychrosphaera sp. 1_MG-2023]
MIDSHCHLDFSRFDQDRDAVLERAALVGVTDFIIPGVTRRHWQRQIDLCRRTEGFHFALGCHPYYINEFVETDLDLLCQLAKQRDCIAIGECGVDSTIVGIEKQIDIFIQHIKIANQLQLPLIVHHRQSHHHIFSAFKICKPNFGGVIHAFSGSLQDSLKYIELGFKLGIGGTITYPRATKTLKVLKEIMLEDIVIETDSPDMPINGFQGSRNEPDKILHVVQSISEIKALAVTHVVDVTRQTTIELFKLPLTK